MTNFKTTKQGRFYPILDNRPPFVSVTTVLQIINKPALVPWAAKREREMCLDVAADTVVDMDEGLIEELSEYNYEVHKNDS